MQLNTGIASARIKARLTTPALHPIQVDRWTMLFDCRCFVFRRKRTKRYFEDVWLKIPALTTRLGSAIPYATFLSSGPALPKDGEAIHWPHHLYSTIEK